MGATTSKNKNANANSNDDELMNMEIVLDQGVKKQIDKLSEYVSVFNSNDVRSLLKIVDDYKLNLETATGRRYDLANVKTFVGKFHKELLDKITTDYPNLSEAEKEAKVKERLRDSALPDYLKNIYENNLGELKTEIMKNPLVVKDTKMGQSIERIFTDITGIKSKYKYFEYRYIQLNLFLIIFIQHVYNTMDKFINSVLAYTVQRDASRSDALRRLIELLLQIMKQAELTIDQKDFEAIDQLMSVVEGSIKDKQVKLNQAVEKARIEALDDMLKLLIVHQNVLDDKTVNGLTKPEESDEFVQQFSMKIPTPRGEGPAPSVANQMGDEFMGFGEPAVPVQSSNRASAAAAPEIEPVNPFGPTPSASASARASGLGAPNPLFEGVEVPQGEGELLAPAPPTNRGAQFGGFVRDHSRFPQAFYDLNSSL